MHTGLIVRWATRRPTLAGRFHRSRITPKTVNVSRDDKGNYVTVDVTASWRCRVGPDNDEHTGDLSSGEIKYGVRLVDEDSRFHHTLGEISAKMTTGRLNNLKFIRARNFNGTFKVTCNDDDEIEGPGNFFDSDEGSEDDPADLALQFDYGTKTIDTNYYSGYKATIDNKGITR